MVVGGGDAGCDGHQMGRTRLGRLPLGSAHVGAAVHPHLARGPGLGGGPLDGVVAIVEVVPEGVELAPGGVASPGVLDDHHIALPGGFERVQHIPREGHGLIVGCPLQQDRAWPWPLWAVDVGIQSGAVPHGNGHVGLDLQRLGCWHGTPPPVSGLGWLRRVCGYPLRTAEIAAVSGPH